MASHWNSPSLNVSRMLLGSRGDNVFHIQVCFAQHPSCDLIFIFAGVVQVCFALTPQ